MACIATVFGSGLGGRVSVSDRKDGVECCTSFDTFDNFASDYPAYNNMFVIAERI